MLKWLCLPVTVPIGLSAILLPFGLLLIPYWIELAVRPRGTRGFVEHTLLAWFAFLDRRLARALPKLKGIPIS